MEGINGNKHLTLAPTNEGKGKIKTSGEMWIKTRYLIGSITENLNDYDEKYMKIKFNSDDELTLNKMIEIPAIITDVRAVFLEKNRYYPQVFLDECLYKI